MELLMAEAINLLMIPTDIWIHTGKFLPVCDYINILNIIGGHQCNQILTLMNSAAYKITRLMKRFHAIPPFEEVVTFPKDWARRCFKYNQKEDFNLNYGPGNTKQVLVDMYWPEHIEGSMRYKYFHFIRALSVEQIAYGGY